MTNFKTVTFTYRNWRGEVRERTVTPIDMTFDENEYHNGPQWFLNGMDSERGVMRSFAMEDILTPIRHVTPVHNIPSDTQVEVDDGQPTEAQEWADYDADC